MARSGSSSENSANARASWTFPPIRNRLGWSHSEASGSVRNALTTSASGALAIAAAFMTGPIQAGPKTGAGRPTSGKARSSSST